MGLPGLGVLEVCHPLRRRYFRAAFLQDYPKPRALHKDQLELHFLYLFRDNLYHGGRERAPAGDGTGAGL